MSGKGESLRDKLRSKIGEKRVDRSSKKVKDKILDKTFKDLGLDREKFDADLKAVRKSGGDISASLQELVSKGLVASPTAEISSKISTDSYHENTPLV